MIHNTSSFTVLTVALVVAVAGSAATAQVVIPAPPATPKTPEFVPPAPPPPAPAPAPAAQPQPAQPVAPAIPSPDLIKRDAKGEIVFYTDPHDEVAIAAFGIKPDNRAKADAVRAERKALFDRHLTKNLKETLEVRDLTRRTAAAADPLKEIQITDLIPAKKVIMSTLLRDNLGAAGVFTAAEVEAIHKSVEAYQNAMSKDASEKSKDLPTTAKFASTAWTNFKRMSLEPTRETNRLFNQFADKWAALKDEASAGASAEAAAAITSASADLAAAKTPTARADAVEKILRALGNEKGAKLLEKVWLPMPENRLIPETPVRPASAPAARPGAPATPPPVQAKPVQPK